MVLFPPGFRNTRVEQRPVGRKRDIKHHSAQPPEQPILFLQHEKRKKAAANRSSRCVGEGSKRLGLASVWLARLLPKAQTGVSGTRTAPLKSSRASSEEGGGGEITIYVQGNVGIATMMI